ncbi:hypothetical protein L1987_17327 [Smallanthus sonchifolius]|uniref:Uncharacterized protein n=1 Tax=Smallanthus sonchifolius TaxID=185202 RepID=A0ACB9IXM6_9ASTR|nr:hypothetical protein L1987_17327 [Smallanthus sonchifolius]
MSARVRCFIQNFETPTPFDIISLINDTKIIITIIFPSSPNYLFVIPCNHVLGVFPWPLQGFNCLCIHNVDVGGEKMK